ncbi:MAG: hypothetical protein O2923_01625 [Verrucomicrobia bacterium]|nr:hypothetical protein [Verrucomicrobiota bacterium]MDA1085684.1 hypothetical protein [Verrucomicrobiota bacterium]
MTWRSILLGILSGAFLCAVTFFNDMVMRGTYLIGNFLPLSVYGGLILFVLLVNPLLARISPRAALSGRELATVMAITLFVCYLPGRGLMHYFTTFMIVPHHHERTRPGWRAEPVAIEYEQVEDWAALAQALAGAGDRPGSEPLRRVWDRLPTDSRDPLRRGEFSVEDGAQRDALLTLMNAAIADPAFHEGLPVPARAPPYVRLLAQRDRATFTPEEHGYFSRGLLELSLLDVVSARRSGVIENVPPRMLADISQDSTRVLDGFVTGLAQGDASISLRDIPWHAWRRTLLFWVPLILTMSIAVTALALVLHRQWSSHEHLPYPTIEFARAMLPGKDQVISATFRSRLFWIGAGIVLFIHMTNYLHTWWPDVIIPVRTNVDMTPLLEIFTTLQRGGASWLFNPSLYFTAIGFAYFLTSEVALSLGVAPFIYCLAVGIAANYGLSFGGGHLKPSIDSFLYLGGYVGMFVTVIHSGRHYYRTTFARSLGFASGDPVELHAVWGARVFLAAYVGFILQLMVVGVEWQIAVLYTLGAIMIFTSISRLLAEAGAFFVHAYCYPCAMLWGFMGATALGRGQLLVLAMVSTLLLIDPRESLMPFAASVLQLGEKMKLRLGRLATWGMIALVIGLTVAVPVALYWQYQRGGIQTGDGWTIGGVSAFAFEYNTEVTRTLEAQGSLRISETLSGWDRFRHIVPQTSLIVAFSTTFLLVLTFTFLRHRFAWWPLHPLIFLALGTWQSRQLAFSFLVGWAIKRAITKYGGAALYRRVMPLMIGLVAGEILSGVIPLIVGAIYYQVTGDPPKPFRILPG